jgi:ABC-2 type transport system ATP-binding protein
MSDVKPVISAKNLVKSYGSFRAVNDLHFSIKRGEVFGLLGPNGAGKTTIILMLLGLSEPDSGSCKVFGYDPVKNPLEVKRLCGYLPERFGFYENLSADSNLRYIAGLNDISGSKAESLINEALMDVGLTKQKKLKVSMFSRGMKQRLGIAQAFFKKPELVILDEPTQGIDPRGIDEVLTLFKRVNKEEGTTILLSSHNMQQVHETCSTIGIMSKGKLVRTGPVKILEAEGGNWIIDVEAYGITQKVMESLKALDSVNQVQSVENGLVVTCDRDIRGAISEALVRNGVTLTRIGLREHTLLDIYRKYSEE